MKRIHRSGQLRPLPDIDSELISLWFAVNRFLCRQADALDSGEWQDFIDLFTDDGIYWMPSLPEQTDWESEPSIFAEDKNLMRIRMKRLQHPRAWSQAVEWGTNHCVSNLVVDGWNIETGDLTVSSRFHVTEVRGDDQRYFAGSYRHELRLVDGEYLISLQRVDLLSAQLPFEYVLQAWL